MTRQSMRWTPELASFDAVDHYGTHLRIRAEEDGEGARPADLVPLGLAACTGYTIVAILKKQRQDLQALEVSIHTEQDPDPPWAYRKITVRYVARGDVDLEKARKALVRSDEKWCAVTATLRDHVELDLEITVAPAEPT